MNGMVTIALARFTAVLTIGSLSAAGPADAGVEALMKASGTVVVKPR